MNGKPDSLASKNQTPNDTGLCAELNRLAKHYDGYTRDILEWAALRIGGLMESSDNALPAARSSERCNCPNGSYGQKHTPECYERRIERLTRELNGEPSSAVETAAKPVPCWCPYCGEPHGVRRAETDPRGTECQHDRFKPKFTLQWTGSTPGIRANTHRFQCRICRETFDLAIGEAQLGSAENGKGDL